MAPAERYDQPTYDLQMIQNLVRVGIYDTARSARADIRALAFSERDVRKCVCSLRAECEAEGGHFFKSMEAENPIARQRGLWQDVYRVPYKHFVLYVKLQHPRADRPVVISFKKK